MNDVVTPTASRSAVQEITIHTDSREILKNAKRDQEHLDLKDYFIVDVDSHHVETDSWPEVLDHIEDPVLRYTGKSISANWPVARQLAIMNHQPRLLFQDAAGRIPHQASLPEEVDDTSVHRDVTLIRRGMESLGYDIQVVFPQPLLEVGLHPNPYIGSSLLIAYNNWFVERILSKEKRMRTLLPLPIESPEMCLGVIKKFKDHPQVIGFMIISQRHTGVHLNEYMPIYKAVEETGMPLGFHAGPSAGDTMTSTMNKFLSIHAMSFVTCNMTHMTNWIINGLPERFPKLKVLWLESGLAWVPFMMQRLDHEFLMRQSDAPSLKRLPSEYIQDMYFTSQPMEAGHLDLLQSTFKAIKAETQLLYSSDWPHWDFDTPGAMAWLPFLNETARRNILGETARKLFNL